MPSFSRLILACALLTSTPAFAQQAPPGPSSKTGDPVKDARIHLGPFHMTPSLAVDRFGVDTNVFNAAGEQKSDFTVGMTPKLAVLVPLGQRFLITSTLSNGINYYKTYTDQGSLDPSISVGGELTLHRVKLFAAQSHTELHQRPNFEIDTRVPLILNGTSVGFSIQPSPRFSIDLSAQKDRADFGEDAVFLGVSLRDRLSRSRQGVRLTVNRRLTSLTTVHVSFENGQDRFRFSPTHDAHGMRSVIGVTLSPRALIGGTADIGFRQMKVASAEVPSFNGLVSKISVGRQFRGSTGLQVEWNRDVEFSLDLIHTYYVLNSNNYRIRRQLAGRFDGIVGLARHKSTYVKVPGVVDSPRTSTKLLTFDLGYRINRDTRLGFAIERMWRTSDPKNGRDFSSIRAGLSFSVGF